MNPILFSNSFQFNTFVFSHDHTTDFRTGCGMHYIGYLQEGTARLVHSDGALILQKGDFFYIPLNCAYRSYWQKEEQVVFVSYGFTYFPNEEGTSYPIQKLLLPPQVGAELLAVNTDLDRSCENIGRFYLALSKILPTMQPSCSNPQQRIVEKAIRFMSEHEDYQIADVAKHCNVSESSLYHLFRCHKGCTPIGAKQALQVEKACRLLATTDANIEEIATKCGFCSAGYFRKVFFRVTGKTPSQIRKNATP